MNEQRQQAYLDLIERLLNCPSGEEPEILQANQDLLDADFLQMLEAVAEYTSQQGDENAANWLRNLAIQLREALNLSLPTAAKISEEDFQAHLQFLMKILQATAESRGDAQVIYPLLVNNTQYLDLNLAELLRRWATSKLAEVETDVAQFIAVGIGNFSNLIQQFPLGDKASNMEIVIAGYETVSTVFTRDAFPQDWAMTQNNLGLAYWDRILGEKAQNIENAIASYTQALSVRTKDALPQDWAMTQNNLGNAYWDRILGDKAQNIEMAIASYTNALEVTTRKAFPQNHAETLFNLGIAYQDVQRFTEAYTTFKSAIETAELLRGEIVSGDEIKRKQAEYFNRIYRRMVEVCLELQKSTEAIEYIERSKTRNLVELLFTPDLYPKLAISEESKNQLQQLQQDIEAEKRRIEQAEKSNLHDSDRTQLNELRQQREQRITRIISLNPIPYDEIHNLLDNETAIIQFYIFDNCFRAKIVKACQDSRTTYKNVASAYQDIENKIDKLPKKGENNEVTTDELRELKNKLKELPQLALEYTRQLRNLEDNHNTIAINEHNYSEKLQQISGIIQDDDLLFLKTFNRDNSPFFQKQIQADLGYFRHGSTLLDQAISSIRGIVEIEQAERDRSLENTIQIVGVGLGAGAIVSGVVTQHIDKPFAPISFNNPPHPIMISLFWSVAASLFFGALAWLWTKFKN